MVFSKKVVNYQLFTPCLHAISRAIQHAKHFTKPGPICAVKHEYSQIASSFHVGPLVGLRRTRGPVKM